jgi:pimeloyl-ACP methyl ester carboxylesterase
VDGVGLHFVHVRGTGPAPLPLVLTHGWPSSFYELLPLVSLLTDPASHGGDPADAFDVVIPSLPGYGFSDPLQGRGSANRVPGLWAQLMSDVLGYDRFGAHGGDIGAMVANRLALEHPERLLGIHVTRPADPYVGPCAAPLTEAEQALVPARVRWHEVEGGYVHLQRTRPQTLAYGLSAGAVATGALNRPHPLAWLAGRQLEQLLVASRGGWHSHLLHERRGHDRGGVGVLVGVDPDDDIDEVCQHSHALTPCPETTWTGRSGPTHGRTVTGHTRVTGWSSSYIRPAAPVPGRSRQPWADKSGA